MSIAKLKGKTLLFKFLYLGICLFPFSQKKVLKESSFKSLSSLGIWPLKSIPCSITQTHHIFSPISKSANPENFSRNFKLNMILFCSDFDPYFVVLILTFICTFPVSAKLEIVDKGKFDLNMLQSTRSNFTHYAYQEN